MFGRLFLVVALAACSRSEPAQTAQPAASGSAPAAEKKPQVVKDPAKAKQMIAGGAVVLDVRTSDEFSGGHLPTATNVPIDDFQSRLPEVEQLAKGNKSQPIVVYCARGGRAQRAKQALEAAGYTNVVNGGGLDDLQQGADK